MGSHQFGEAVSLSSDGRAVAVGAAGALQSTGVGRVFSFRIDPPYPPPSPSPSPLPAPPPPSPRVPSLSPQLSPTIPHPSPPVLHPTPMVPMPPPSTSTVVSPPSPPPTPLKAAPFSDNPFDDDEIVVILSVAIGLTALSMCFLFPRVRCRELVRRSRYEAGRTKIEASSLTSIALPHDLPAEHTPNAQEI